MSVEFSFFWLALVLVTTTVLGIDNPQEDQEDRPCIPRDFGKGSVVCICNSTYCDATLIPLFNSDKNEFHKDLPPKAIVWTSSKSGSRLHKSITYFNNGDSREVIYSSQHFLSSTDKNFFRKRGVKDSNNGLFTYLPKKFNQFTDSITSSIAAALNEISLFHFVGDFPRPDKLTKFTIRQDVKYQKILGFGGAFTDSTGVNVAFLSKATQENLLKSYFGREGSNYNMGRLPIGGTDFSTRPYTLLDGGIDVNLTAFSLQQEDFNLKIPMIKWANYLRNSSLKLVASPWSAPAWMKTGNRIHGMGVLKNEYYQTWADYFVRFLQEYKKQGVEVTFVTTGNEPLNGLIPNWPFNSLGWSAKNMRKWIVKNLGPTLTAMKPQLDVKIITLDDNKGAIPTWAEEILGHEDSAKYVSGIGTHWYYDFLTGSDVLERFHKKYPNYFILQTEACLGFTPWETEKVILGSWNRGETYLASIISDMKNFVSGWIDWNLVLDLKGGPNWANLMADAAILVNPSKDEFFKQPIYYAIAHVSKFVTEDSVRIDVQVRDSPRNLLHIAFLRPDNATVLIFLNRLNYDAKVSLFDESRGTLRIDIPAQSMQTIMYI